jgi:hypothetical protein
MLFALCLLMALISGCSKSSVRQYIRPDMDVSSLQTVAVLPLKNFTADRHADEKIRSRISIELLTRGVNIIEPGEIEMRSLPVL